MVVPKLIRSKDVKLEGEVGHPMLDVNMLDLSDGRHAGCVFSWGDFFFGPSPCNSKTSRLSITLEVRDVHSLSLAAQNQSSSGCLIKKCHPSVLLLLLSNSAIQRLKGFEIPDWNHIDQRDSLIKWCGFWCKWQAIGYMPQESQYNHAWAWIQTSGFIHVTQRERERESTWEHHSRCCPKA